MTAAIRRILGRCNHGQPKYRICAPCLQAISDEARS